MSRRGGRQDDDFRVWLHPSPLLPPAPSVAVRDTPTDRVAFSAQLEQSAAPSTLDPIPTGLYGMLDYMALDHLHHFLTKQSEIAYSQQQPNEILFFRMPCATRTVEEEEQTQPNGEHGAPVSISSTSPSASSPSQQQSEFDWTSSLSGEGCHWLWFKYGPALAHLLNTELNCQMAVWMVPQFQEDTLNLNRHQIKYAGPVLFKRMPRMEEGTPATEEKVDDPDGKPANLQLSAHPHPLLLYSSRYYGGFRCDVCKSSSSDQCYACNDCGWDCCMKCFTDNGGYDPNPKPLPNPSEQKQITADDLLYTSHTLSMQPSYQFQLFKHGASTTSTSVPSSSLIDGGLLSFHQVLRWLHQQLGSDSSCKFDLDAALKASADLEQKSQFLCQGIQAVLELQYLAKLFPEVWCSLHPAVLSKFEKPRSNVWEIDELSGVDQSIDQFIRTMDPTVGLEQVDLQMTQTSVQHILSLLVQLNNGICSRYHASTSLRFIPQSQLLELLKQGPCDQNRLVWHLKSGGYLDEDGQLVRLYLATFAHAIQSSKLFTLLAVCPDPHPSDESWSPTGRSDPWSDYDDGAKYRVNDTSGIFIPKNVSPLETLPLPLIHERKQSLDRLTQFESQNHSTPIEPTPEQIAESIRNFDWRPMCSGQNGMQHCNPAIRWEAPRWQSAGKRGGFVDTRKRVPLHKMVLIQPSSKDTASNSWGSGCDLCHRRYIGPGYRCSEHMTDICLDCGRESQIKWLQSIVDDYNTHRLEGDARVICIRPISMAESDCMTIMRTVLERGDSEAATSSTTSPPLSMWFDDFDFDRLLNAIWSKSPALQSIEPLEAFMTKLSTSQKNISQLVHFFHVATAFKFAYSEYPSMIDSLVQQMIPSGEFPGLAVTPDDLKSHTAPQLPARLFTLHEDLRRSTELPSLSSTSLDRMKSVSQAASSILRALYSRVSRVHLGWKPIETTSELQTEILAQFRKPIVLGILNEQRNGLSASSIIQQLIPCLARIFHRYYEEEAAAGSNVMDDRKIQFWLANEQYTLPNDLWNELKRIDPPYGTLFGALLLLPPVDSKELRVSNVPFMQPYHNVTYANDRYANPDDPREGRGLTLEPAIRTMHEIFRDPTGSPLFDIDAILRLSTPFQEQSEVFEKCVRICESVAKLDLHIPSLDQQLRAQVGPSMSSVSFQVGLEERGQFIEELDVEYTRNQLKPLEQFTRLHTQLRDDQNEKKKERLAKRKQNADGVTWSTSEPVPTVTIPPSVLSFAPTHLQSQQISSILSALDAEVKATGFASFDDATRIMSGGRMSIFRWPKQTGTTADVGRQVENTSASSSSSDLSSETESQIPPFDYHWLIVNERVISSAYGGEWMGTEVSCRGSEGAAAKGTSTDFMRFCGSVRKCDGEEANARRLQLQLPSQIVEVQIDNPEWFEDRGVDLKNESSVQPDEICRACYGDPLIRPSLFCSELTLRAFCNNSPSDLRPLLQLYDWNHPSGYRKSSDWEKEGKRESSNAEIANGSAEQTSSSASKASDSDAIPPRALRPSLSKTYRLIAELLVGRAGDAAVASALWQNKKSELEPGNTHWKYWPQVF